MSLLPSSQVTPYIAAQLVRLFRDDAGDCGIEMHQFVQYEQSDDANRLIVPACDSHLTAARQGKWRLPRGCSLAPIASSGLTACC